MQPSSGQNSQRTGRSKREEEGGGWHPGIRLLTRWRDQSPPDRDWRKKVKGKV